MDGGETYGGSTILDKPFYHLVLHFVALHVTQCADPHMGTEDHICVVQYALLCCFISQTHGVSL